MTQVTFSPLGIGLLVCILAMVVCMVWCNLKKNFRRLRRSPSGSSSSTFASLPFLIYSPSSMPTIREYQRNSNTQYYRDTIRQEVLKETASTAPISGLPTYEESEKEKGRHLGDDPVGTPVPDYDDPPPYSASSGNSIDLDIGNHV